MGVECIPQQKEFLWEWEGGGPKTTMKSIIGQYMDGNQTILNLYGPMEDWCFEPAAPSSFKHAFWNHSDFNIDISGWNMTGVTDVRFMFDGCKKFNMDIGKWDLKPTYVAGMLYGTASFNQDLSGWDMSNVEQFTEMFRGAELFNSNISAWDVSKGVSFDMMFREATHFQGNLSSWNVKSGATFDGIFMDTDYAGDAPFCEPNCLAPTESFNEYCPVQYDTWHEEDYPLAKKLTVIIPRILALFSMASSLYVIRSLIGTKIARRGINTLPTTPPGLYPNARFCADEYYHSLVWPYRAGSIATCNAQGMVLQIGIIGSIMFTGLLSLSCLLTVKYRWNEPRLRRFERFTVPFVVTFAVGSAIYLAVVEQFNPLPTGFCYIWSYPTTAMYESYRTRNPYNFRGDENWLMNNIIFSMSWVGMSLLVIIVSMSMLFFHVKKVTARSSRYGATEYLDATSSSQQGGLSPQARMVATKGSRYAGVLLLLYIPAITIQVMDSILWYYIELVLNCLLTSQGILNALVYGSSVSKISMSCSCFKLSFCGDSRKEENTSRNISDESPIVNPDDPSPSVVFDSKIMKQLEVEKSIPAIDGLEAGKA